MRIWLIVLFLLPSLVFSQVVGRSSFAVSPIPAVGGDSVILAEVWYHGDGNSADSSGNVRDATYAGSYDGSFFIEGTDAFEFESIDILTYGSFTWNDTFAVCMWYYHEDSESEVYRAYGAQRGNDTDGWTIEFDQINGDIEHHKFVSGVSYEARTANGRLTVLHDTWILVIVQVAGPTTEFYMNDVYRTSDNTTITNDNQTGDVTMGAPLNTTIDAVQVYNFVLTSDQRTWLYQHPENSLKDPP